MSSYSQAKWFVCLFVFHEPKVSGNAAPGSLNSLDMCRCKEIVYCMLGVPLTVNRSWIITHANVSKRHKQSGKTVQI